MRVLIVDDDSALRRGLRQLVGRLPQGEAIEAESVLSALAVLNTSQPDVILLDLRLSGLPGDRSGLEVLRELRRTGRSIPTIVITSSNELTDLREAMRLGARDYVLKDELSAELLLPILEDLREHLDLKVEMVKLRERLERSWGTAALIGSSPEMERVRRVIARVADSSSTVLIRGATGTGKELVARALHQLSKRRSEPFLAVNCSALPGTLMESILFGHERGSFTGADRRIRGQLELAGGGTVLLDEIAEMPLELQAKLLRVLEDHRFRPLGAESELTLRARLVASTHVDLERRIVEGRFREDLYYRLNVVSIDLPTLAARGEDMVELLLAFSDDFTRKLRYTTAAVEWLRHRDWKGNVRELRNMVERLSLLSDEDVIDVPTLDELARDRAPRLSALELERTARQILALPDDVGSKLTAIERTLIQLAMTTCEGNKSAAARILGVERKVLERKWGHLPKDEEE